GLSKKILTFVLGRGCRNRLVMLSPNSPPLAGGARGGGGCHEGAKVPVRAIFTSLYPVRLLRGN
ncbi:MAG: hypothetical protein JW932_09650, partial [Deltaproteobacteria bacterium]|nr:hypothetical protein [Deltaproteobacteria bacterium]